jgi:gluconokinase
VVILVMGVAGVGKTTVGTALAEALGWRFVDADDFHSPENRARMAAGRPLDDAARAPWLAALAAAIDGWLEVGDDVVLACSALRRSYRAALRRDPERVRLVYLRAAEPLLAARLGARRDHFMPASLLTSQLATLEEPGPEEGAIVVDAAEPLAALVAHIRSALASASG